MYLGVAVSKRIDELLFKNNLSLYMLAKQSTIPLTTLTNLYRGHTKCPTLAVIYKLAKAFDMTPIDFLNCEILRNDDIELD